MFESLNENKLLVGLVLIFLNIGSKFIVIELSETQKQLLSNTILRQVLVFCVAFAGTRDVMMSLLLTAIFVILVDGVLHEDSPISLVPKLVKPQKDEGVFGNLRVIAGAPAHVQNPAFDSTPALT